MESIPYMSFLKKRIYALQNELDDFLTTHSISSLAALKLSLELDDLIVEYHNLKGKPFDTESIQSQNLQSFSNPGFSQQD
jgi:hypothetical protein